MVPHMTLSKTLMYHTFYLHTLLCPYTHVVCPHTHDNTLSLSLSVPVSSAKPVSDKNPLPVPPRHYDNLDHHTMFTNNTIYTFFRLFQVKRLLLNLHYICNYMCIHYSRPNSSINSLAYSVELYIVAKAPFSKALMTVLYCNVHVYVHCKYCIVLIVLYYTILMYCTVMCMYMYIVSIVLY